MNLPGSVTPSGIGGGVSPASIASWTLFPHALCDALACSALGFVLGLKPGDLCLAVALDLGQGALDCINSGGLAGT